MRELQCSTPLDRHCQAAARAMGRSLTYAPMVHCAVNLRPQSDGVTRCMQSTMSSTLSIAHTQLLDRVHHGWACSACNVIRPQRNQCPTRVQSLSYLGSAAGIVTRHSNGSKTRSIARFEHWQPLLVARLSSAGRQHCRFTLGLNTVCCLELFCRHERDGYRGRAH